jgi:hypothetical protein
MEVVFGECELAIGDEPDKQAAIAAALSARAIRARARAPRGFDTAKVERQGLPTKSWPRRH